MKYYIKTFGCQQNLADSERLAGYYQSKGYTETKSYDRADIVIVNTCVVRQKAEDRIYGFINNLKSLKKNKSNFKITLTGCLVGTSFHDHSGKSLARLKRRLPLVDEFLPIEEVGFNRQAVRHDKKHALVPISYGCNNFCSFCIVPFARGREISRPFKEIINEIIALAKKRGYEEITLLGQNVNSYGSDLIKNARKFKFPDGSTVKPVLVKHLGRKRIPTLFPYLLDSICQIKGIKKVTFISANPWDFSSRLIKVIRQNKKIDRIIHLPVQSGNNKILQRMNRWYTKKQYTNLIRKIKRQVPEAKFTTDIIVGFPGETKKAFQDTVDLVRRVKFIKAFIACYSPRQGTIAVRKFTDNTPLIEKKRRFHVLDKMINHQKNTGMPSWLRPER